MRLKTISLKRAQNIRLVFLAQLWLNFRRQTIQGQQPYNFSDTVSFFFLLFFPLLSQKWIREITSMSEDFQWRDSLWITSVHPVLIPTSASAFPFWCSGTLTTNASKTELISLKQHNHFVASLGLFSFCVASIYISPISLPQFLLKSQLWSSVLSFRHPKNIVITSYFN